MAQNSPNGFGGKVLGISVDGELPVQIEIITNDTYTYISELNFKVFKE